MKKLLSLTVAVLTVLGAIPAVAAGGLPFTDVPAGAWYYDTVAFVSEKGLMKGITETVFSPSGKTTRAQIVTVMARIAGADTAGLSSALTFSDTPASGWYADSIGWAVSSGLVSGYPDGTFRPDAPVRRQELAVLFDRFANHTRATFSSQPLCEKFSDAALIPEWARDAAESMRENGLIGGDDRGRFNPSSTATRAEIATVLERFVKGARDPMYYALGHIYDLVECRGNKIVIRLLCRDRIVGSGTSKSLSEQLLPQMGLPTDEYEIVINPGHYRELIYNTDCSFTGDAITNNNGVALSDNLSVCGLAIKNKGSGETTPFKACRLLVSREFGPVVLDPDGFESGIPDDLYAEMKEGALYTLGDVARFKNAFDKASRGEPITAIYIGGSVTARASAGDDHCFAKLIQNWLEKTFPDSEMTYVNQGIASTSYYASLRLGQCVLDHDPDLVFIEFAQNDTGSLRDREGFETMIRRILGDTDAAVMAILTGIARESCCKSMKEAADRYGFALCDVRTGADLALERGAIFDIDLTYDGGHPREWGHNLIADMAVHELKAIMEAAKNFSGEISRDLPDRITPADTEGLTYVSAGSFRDSVPTGWTITRGDKFSEQLETRDFGADPFTFEFYGRDLYVICYGSDSFRISVDGGEFYTADAGGGYVTALRSEEAASHTVVIEPCAGEDFTPEDEEDVWKIRIGGFSYR